MSVSLPSACEDLTAPVPDPGVHQADARVAIARTRAALGEANGRLAKAGECFRVVREHYATGG